MRRILPAMLALATMYLVACGEEATSAPCGRPPEGPTVRLVYRVGGENARGTAARVCTRLRALGAPRAEVSAAGGDRIRIVVPDSAGARAAVDAAVGAPSLGFHDWEPSVLGRRGPAAPFAGATALFDAVETASTPGRPAELLYLFDPEGHPLAGPASSCEELLAAYRHEPGSASYAERSRCRARLRDLGGGGPPSGSRVLGTPDGVAVVEDEAIPGQPPQLHRYFAIEDDAELTAADIENPRADADAVTGEPVVLFDFTASGRQAFKRLTGRVAARAKRVAAAGDGPSESSFQHFAIVLDNRIVSLAAVDPVANPGGIDAPGAQIGGIGSRQATRLLARRLAAGPLDAELELVSVR
jgi:SecD/SecF fusion protein